MNAVMIIPTGIGCEIGGHAGDATPSARLLASVCEILILHPNVVNASDINEMPTNSLYVDGMMLDRFLAGGTGLIRLKKQNRILIVGNTPIQDETINAVSAARACLGIDAFIVELKTPLVMKAFYENGIASGSFSGIQELLQQTQDYEFDALAIHTPIECSKLVTEQYFNKGGVNPWGGIEAKTCREISVHLHRPVAHAPVIIDKKELEFSVVTDPRIAAEMVSSAFMHCVLKGLQWAPQEGIELSVGDVDALVSPLCWGYPHECCARNGVPIVFVKENRTTLYGDSLSIAEISDPKDCETYYVSTYLEAAGLLAAMKEGITVESLCRPLQKTEVIYAG